MWEYFNHHRDEAALHRGRGLNSSRVNGAEALSPAWWISSGAKATRGQVFHGRVPDWPITSVMWMVCVKELWPPLQRDRGGWNIFFWGGAVHLGGVLRRSGQNARMWWDCLSTRGHNSTQTASTQWYYRSCQKQTTLLIIWLAQVCLWPPRTRVTMVAAAVASALVILVILINCALCVSHSHDGWPLRTIHP